VVERDVIFAKIASIDRCIRRIGEVRAPGRGLQPVDVEDLVELNLQRAVQAAIDLAAHVVATESYGIPGKLAETFTLLEREGVVTPELAERLRRMTGFRNIAVHEYEDVDPRVVASIVEHHLDDLRQLAQAIVVRFRLAAGASGT
jgi:uncharacterized protein YutE (UPF0331/DUF86 family)